MPGEGGWKLSESLSTTKGLCQGDGLACLLFILALEKAIQDSRVASSGTIFYKSFQILPYADAIDIIGLRLSYVAETYQGIEQATENLGLQIDATKTKLMVVTSEALPTTNPNLRRRDLQIGERTFEVIPEFTYLRSKDSNDNSMEAECLVANTSFYSLRKQFTSNNLSRRTKLERYSTGTHIRLWDMGTVQIWRKPLSRVREEDAQKDLWPRMCERTMEEPF